MTIRGEAIPLLCILFPKQIKHHTLSDTPLTRVPFPPVIRPSAIAPCANTACAYLLRPEALLACALPFLLLQYPFAVIIPTLPTLLSVVQKLRLYGA